MGGWVNGWGWVNWCVGDNLHLIDAVVAVGSKCTQEVWHLVEISCKVRLDVDGQGQEGR